MPGGAVCANDELRGMLMTNRALGAWMDESNSEATKMAETQTENGGRRSYRTGYIRTRPIPPGYDITWGEVIDKGEAMYERLRGELEARYPGQYAVFDVVSGAYEIAPDTATAGRRLEKRCPTLKTWIVKISAPGNTERAKGDD